MSEPIASGHDDTRSAANGGAPSGTLRLALNGAAGRMGRQLLQAIEERDDARLVAAADAPGGEVVGLDAGVLIGTGTAGVTLSDDLLAEAALADVDVVIDFTTPAASLALLEGLAARGGDTGVVLGTTGLDSAQRARLGELSGTVPLVYAANYSVGVTLALDLLEQAARALDEDYDIEVIEAHHRHKVDAPSGTALAMGEALARGRGRALDEVALYAREGITGARARGAIGFATVRAGDIVGEHTVLFGTAGERLEITHRATERLTFARGAVRAAAWLAGRGPGLYDMRDVLGLDAARP